MATTALITAEEFEQMPDTEHTELVRGELIQMSPPGREHAWLQLRLGQFLGAYVDEHDLGEAYGEIGIVIPTNPDSVLAPDLAFVSNATLGQEGMKSVYLRHTPDLVVEIVSPGDSHSQVVEKVMTYLEAGVPLVWEIDPRRKRIIVWQADHTVKELKPGDTLDGGDILPGFQLRVAEVFSK